MKIDIAEHERQTGRKLGDPGAIEELRQSLAGLKEKERGSQVFSSLGAEYQVGALRVPALTLGMFPILDLIDSPFVSALAEEREFKRLDLIYVLYVAVHGIECARSLMGIRQRIAAVEKYRDLATTPEMLDVFLRRVDQIAAEKSEFERQVIGWFDGLGLDDWREVEDVVESMFTDLYDVIQAFDNGDGKKKRNAMTPTG